MWLCGPNRNPVQVRERHIKASLYVQLAYCLLSDGMVQHWRKNILNSAAISLKHLSGIGYIPMATCQSWLKSSLSKTPHGKHNSNRRHYGSCQCVPVAVNSRQMKWREKVKGELDSRSQGFTLKATEEKTQTWDQIQEEH